MQKPGDEERQLRSVALQNAHSIMLARQRAEDELVRTKEALRESQERLRAALGAAGTGTFRWNLQTNAIEWDASLDRLFGAESGAMTQSMEAFLAVVHPDDRAAVVAQIERCVTDGADFDLQYRVIWPDGSLHWLDEKAKAFFDRAGTPVYMTGACADITKSKQTEAALREETRVLELLNATGRIVATQLEVQALLQAVTDAATELSGARFGAFFYNTIGKDGEEFLLFTLSGAPREAFEKFGNPRATALFGPTFRGEPPIRSDDIRKDPRYGTMGPHHGMPAGHLPVVSYLGVPVRSRSGVVIGGLFFGHPEPGVFTERTERLIVGVAAQAGVALDNAQLYEGAQKAAQERKVLLENERRLRSAAEQLSNIKDEFLATLSHELRTPLNAILGWSRVLRTGAKDRDDLMKGLETIERNAKAQTRLIEDLLDMSRIASGKLRLDIQPVMPSEIVDGALETLKPAADARGIRLEKLLDPDAGPITGDPYRLQQVVWNLLSNAIKFTPKGGKVQVHLARVNSHIEIRVADTGIGIDTDLIPDLFERFRQADASTTRHYGGLGLGLSIVKNLVELHGGTVSIASPGQGKGTTVTVQLPITVVHPQRDAEDRQHPSSSQGSASLSEGELAELKVVVVDDQSDARDLIKRVLEGAGARVRAASTVDEAVQLIVSDTPDVLLSDIGMPDADGFELLRRVRLLAPEQGGRVPAIALTAFARSEDRTQVLRAGFLVHIAKPVDPAELVATIASVARRGIL
ncbi:MAG: ATP-binding protein [Acidobacteriota bacterium]|nr:ATP-binding protein [Acidobacteriota bacterium]